MRFRVLIPLIGVIALFLPSLTHAAIPFFGPIIPAAQASCPAGWALVMTVINNIISLLITLLIVFIAPLTIAWAGFLYVVNPVDPSGKSKAKSILIHTVVGLVVALAGWLIVDFVMAVLYNKDATGKTWSTLVTGGGDTCIKIATQLNPAAPPVGTSPGTGTSTTPGVTPAAGFDPVVAARTLAFSVSATQSGGACAYSVRTNALIPGGLSSFSSSYPNAAADYGSYLTKAGFKTVSASNYSRMIGDIVVFDRSDSHTFGHIEMYTDNGWISDFIQKTMYPWAGGSYTIYRWPQGVASGPGDSGPASCPNIETSPWIKYTTSGQPIAQGIGNPQASSGLKDVPHGAIITASLPKNSNGTHNAGTIGVAKNTTTGDWTFEMNISKCPGDLSYKASGCYTDNGWSGGLAWNVTAALNNCTINNIDDWYINYRFPTCENSTNDCLLEYVFHVY
jgi:hypothetical protein